MQVRRPADQLALLAGEAAATGELDRERADALHVSLELGLALAQDAEQQVAGLDPERPGRLALFGVEAAVGETQGLLGGVGFGRDPRGAERRGDREPLPVLAEGGARGREQRRHLARTYRRQYAELVAAEPVRLAAAVDRRRELGPIRRSR